jgi:hypothetical protein
MKNNFKIVFLFAFAIVLLSSCCKENELTPKQNGCYDFDSSSEDVRAGKVIEESNPDNTGNDTENITDPGGDDDDEKSNKAKKS